MKKPINVLLVLILSAIILSGCTNTFYKHSYLDKNGNPRELVVRRTTLFANTETSDLNAGLVDGTTLGVGSNIVDPNSESFKAFTEGIVEGLGKVLIPKP